MKVPRHARPTEEGPLSVKNKPVFKVAPVLSQRTLSLLPSSPSTKRTSINSTTSSSSSIPSNIQSIANTMKLRMKAAVKTMVWNNNNRALLSSLVSQTIDTSNSSSSPQQQKQQLLQDQKPLTLFPTTLATHTLLKQYLSFVQEETGALVDMESSPASATDSLPMSSLDYQPHPLASSGATLIESLVYEPISKMTESYKQNDANQKRPPSRSSSGDTTSKMEIDELKADPIQQIKKSERLRLKQQQKQQHKHNSPSTCINNNEQPTEAAAATGIRCICDNPHEEFGSMVQCDDCSYWLHLNCLALNEDSLDDTYRCPSCYVTLGPGQHALSCTVTWRLAAQLKSKKLASRHGNSRDHRNIRKRHLGPPKHKKSTLKQRLVQLRQKQHWRIRHQPLYSAYGDEYNDNDSCSTSSDSNDGSDDLEYDRQRQSWMIPKMTIDPAIKTTMTTPTGNVLVQVFGARPAISNDPVDDENLFDSDATESDCELGDTYQHDLLEHQYRLDNGHRGSVSSSSSLSSSSSVATVPSLVSSPSHASSDLDSTSDEHYGNDDFYALGITKPDSSILSTTASSACLDQESLLWLSRLAYLESLQSSSKQQCFTPHASDVFLCADQQEQQNDRHHQHQANPLAVGTTTTNEDHCYYTQLTTTPAMTSSTRSDPPSTICSHDLSQFSFDADPFWSPTHHQVTDSCPFF